MALHSLNCPTCRKRLVYVPLDGLTLHYRCAEHGLVIFKPLVIVADYGGVNTRPMSAPEEFHSHDAA